MPNGPKKGSSFERSICKMLSNWWRPGRDDIFWRSSQSGGRATFRSQKGKTTAGSYGDIAAVDPIGVPLLRAFTIELKRGKSHGEPGDMLDCKGDLACHKWTQTMKQAIDSHRLAGSHGWLIISQRDFRHPVAFFPRASLSGPLAHAASDLTRSPCFFFKLWIPGAGRVFFIGTPLDRFLARTEPSEIELWDRNR